MTQYENPTCHQAFLEISGWDGRKTYEDACFGDAAAHQIFGRCCQKTFAFRNCDLRPGCRACQGSRRDEGTRSLNARQVGPASTPALMAALAWLIANFWIPTALAVLAPSSKPRLVRLAVNSDTIGSTGLWSSVSRET